MDWQDRTEVKKGNLGEEIVKNVLESKGYIVYKCGTKGAHAFDFLAVKNKQVLFIAEVKSKARLNKFYATGINTKHYKEYKYIYNKHNIDILLFFVDEHPSEKRIYCQKLSILMQNKTIDNISYPNTEIAKDIVLFSLSDMINVCYLSDEQMQMLKSFSNRSYDYY